MNGRRPLVVALGAVDPTLVTEVLGDGIEFVAQPGPEDLAGAEGSPRTPSSPRNRAGRARWPTSGPAPSICDRSFAGTR